MTTGCQWNTHEKIHNRNKSRVAGSASDACPGAQDHEQWMGEVWPPDQDQWRQATSSKPSRIEAQAASFKLQAQYEHIPVV